MAQFVVPSLGSSRFEPEAGQGARCARPFGRRNWQKLYESVGLRLTERDKNDWILALDLLIEAALTRVAVTAT